MPSSIREPRRLIDRRKLAAAAAAAAELPEAEQRPALVAAARAALEAGRAEAARRLVETGSGSVYVAAHCFVVDQVIRALFDDATTRVFPAPNPTLSERISLVAVGGYGRGELAPHSDIDLLFLHSWKASPRVEQVVEHLLYLLWDLGLKVGHATRSVDECVRLAQGDVTIATALLESRWVWGEQDLAVELRQRFDAEVIQAGPLAGLKFVEAKLVERDQRHARLGDSRYLLEPNLKEGKGGLRDLHTLFWIAKWLYRAETPEAMVERGVLTQREAARFRKAEEVLRTLRCHLHLVAGRAEERITFDVQAELARRMGYTDHVGSRGVERVMKHYYLIAKAVGDLTRIFCAAMESQHARKPRLRLPRFLRPRSKELDGFVVDGERLRHPSDAGFLADPVNLIRVFAAADRAGLDIHPETLRLITQNLRLVDAELRADPEANRLFLSLLVDGDDPEAGLRRLSEAGVLSRFVPDFGRVVAQMQFDMYHSYTVDEHTIRAVGVLADIERGDRAAEMPLATQLFPLIQSRRALYVAILLHDIAKGRGGDHSELGEQVALKLGPRFGLTAEETETAAWLVRWHLLLSDTAFKRDIADPKTVRDLVAKVQSPEWLRLLLILTCADIRAVGPNVWNAWKNGLLTELYHSCAEMLAAEVLNDPGRVSSRTRRLEQAAEGLRAALPDWTDAEFEEHWALGSSTYFLTAEPETLARQARLARRAAREGLPLEIEHKVDPVLGVTEVTVCAVDHPGLFAQVAGAIAVAGGTIVDARVFTLANGLALDTFAVQDAMGGAIDRPEKLARLAVAIGQALDGKVRMREQLARRPSAPTRTLAIEIPARVLIDNRASATHTVIEVNGRDRPGLLYELGAALTQMSLSIHAAKIATFGLRVVDTFYVKDVFGMKIERPEKLEAIRARLLSALDPECVGALAEAAE